MASAPRSGRPPIIFLGVIPWLVISHFPVRPHPLFHSQVSPLQRKQRVAIPCTRAGPRATAAWRRSRSGNAKNRLTAQSLLFGHAAKDWLRSPRHATAHALAPWLSRVASGCISVVRSMGDSSCVVCSCGEVKPRFARSLVSLPQNGCEIFTDGVGSTCPPVRRHEGPSVCIVDSTSNRDLDPNPFQTFGCLLAHCAEPIPAGPTPKTGITGARRDHSPAHTGE